MNAGPILRKRTQILAASLLASGFLALAYHFSATPVYQATAEFKLNGNHLEDSAKQFDSPAEIQAYLTKADVLDRLIASLPEAHQLDWNDCPFERRCEILRENLTFQVMPQRDAIRVACRSRQAARPTRSRGWWPKPCPRTSASR